MKTYIALFFLGISINLQAQPKYYETALDIGGTIQSGGSIMPLSDTTYLIVGAQLTTYEEGIEPVLTIVDRKKNILNNYPYFLTDTGFNLRCLTSLKYDNDIIISGQHDNYYLGGDDWESNSFFLKIGTNGNFKNLIIYESLDFRQHTHHMKATADHHLLLAGMAFALPGTPAYGNRSYQFLIKTDTAGHIIWKKYYTVGGYGRWLTGVQPAADNSGYYLIGNANIDYSPNPDLMDMVFIKTDTAGNILYSQVWNDEEQEYPVGSIPTPDGGLLVVGSMRPGELGEDGILRGRIVKLDAVCGVDWYHSYFYGAGFSHIVAAPNGNYVLGGGDGDPDFPYDWDAMLVKITPTGNVLWRRRYGTNQQDYLYDLIADSDGGYVFVGRKDSIELDRAFVYMVKTNCMGLLTEPTAAFAYQTNTDGTMVELFNQSLYAYPDSIDGGHYIWDFGDGSPPYICGQGYEPCPDVVTHNYATAQAQYTITLTAVVCSDTSAVTALVVPGSGAGGQSVGVQVAESGVFGVRVYPNPASETLTIHYNSSSNTQAAQWILYDMSGHILQTLPFVGSRQAVIDISSLPEGLYYFTLSQNDAVLQRGKLVFVR